MRSFGARIAGCRSGITASALGMDDHLQCTMIKSDAARGHWRPHHRAGPAAISGTPVVEGRGSGSGKNEGRPPSAIALCVRATTSIRRQSTTSHLAPTRQSSSRACPVKDRPPSRRETSRPQRAVQRAFATLQPVYLSSTSLAPRWADRRARNRGFRLSVRWTARGTTKSKPFRRDDSDCRLSRRQAVPTPPSASHARP